MSERIRRLLERARWDLDDALTERNVGVKRQMRDRARMSVKLARLLLHSEIREAKAAVPSCLNLLDNGQPCGDEGRMCAACSDEAMREHSWMRGRSKGACTGVMSEQDKQDLRDGGRGHLVRS